VIKLLYLLVGIMLKQPVDELKSFFNEYVDELKKERENIQTFRLAPAVEMGGKEA